MEGKVGMTYDDNAEQQQQEQERLELTIQALDRLAEAGAKKDDIVFLAHELGIRNYEPLRLNR